MHSKAHIHTLIPYVVPFLVMVALVMAIMVMPAWTQNAVPPAARQSGVQAFAPRLTPPGTPHGGRKPPALARTRTRRGWPLDQVIYENGPVDGEDLGWTINFGFSVTDSIQISASVTSMQFWAWLIPGDTLTSVEMQFGANPFGNELFDQTVNLTSSNCFSNQFGYNVCLESAYFTGPTLSGTAWLTLLNASVPSGDPAYWDQNSGPSQAAENTIGTIPSEAFTVLGMTTTTTTTQPPQCFGSGNPQIIHDFTSEETGDYPVLSGVIIDKAGNLYGTTPGGGDNRVGLAYKQYRAGDGWIFDPLYSFAGGYNGELPAEVMVGRNGSLYGAASGGIQDCGNDGSQYCGLVFNLRPQPTTCLTTQCSWMEKVPYRFSGGSDASGSINLSASDQEGNLYGTSTSGGGGGCNGLGCGTIFELSPTIGGWSESILYNFTGGSYGFGPSQVLVGKDGNLYGVADGGAYGQGLVFQLTPSGDHWTESVLHAFQGTGIDGETPSYLVQDSVGNLYGIAQWYCYDCAPEGPIFMLQKAGAGWIFSEYLIQRGNYGYEYLNNLTIDAAGNLYGTGWGGQGCCCGGHCDGIPDDTSVYYFIFNASYGSDGWQYQDLRVFYNVLFPVDGALALDAQGNLYGTTGDCGAHGDGTIWQFSP